MRFDDPAYVEVWSNYGDYPAIHAPLRRFVTDYLEPGTRVLDLCSGTGLLGRWLAGQGYYVWWVEANTAVVERSVAAGVFDHVRAGDVLNLRVTDETLPELVGFMKSNVITAVVARRAIPELSERCDIGALGVALVDGGATDLFLEGRVRTSSATHALATLEAEIDALSTSWSPILTNGALAHLRAV